MRNDSLKRKRFFSRNNNKRGWILVDVLIGTLIISIALVALTLTFTQASRNMVESRSRVQALSIVQQELELLKRFESKDAPPFERPDPKTVTLSNVEYDVNYPDITVAEIAGLTKLVPVKIIVFWPPDRSVELVEYLVVN